MKRSAFFLACTVFALSAHAGSVSQSGPIAVRAGSGWTVGYPATGGTAIASSARTITADAAAATVRDLIPIQAPGGALAVTAARTVTMSSVALGALELAGKAAFPIAVGMTLYDLYKGSGLRRGPSGDLEYDAGTQPTDQQVTEYWIGSAVSASDPANACENYRTYLQNNDGSTSCTPTGGCKVNIFQGILVYNSYNVPICKISRLDAFTGAMIQEKYRYEAIAKQTTTQKKCGTGETRLDGLCVTDVWVNATQVPDSNKLSNLQKAITALGLGSVLEKLLSTGQSVQGSAVTVSGPASQTMPPETSVTQSPSGNISTTNNTTYNYTYKGDTISYTTNTQTTTVTTSPDGTSKTETKNQTKIPDPVPSTLCDIIPDALSCMKAGTVPDAPAVPSKDVPLSMDKVNFGGQGSCPPPITFTAYGGTYAIPWTGFCDALVTWVRPVVLVVSIATAAIVFIGGLKS